MVANHVATVAKVYTPLTKLIGQVLNYTSETRLLPQYFYPMANSLHCALGSIHISGGEEAMQALYINECRLRPD
jgi:hypothetical protein